MATVSTAINDFVAGDPLPLGQRGVTNLATVASAAFFAVYSVEDHTTPALFSSTSGGGSTITVTNPGVVQGDGTYTAQVQPSISAADSAKMIGGKVYWLYISVTSGGSSYVSEIVPLQPLA